jgi:lipopolysaccharide export system protein LptC
MGHCLAIPDPMPLNLRSVTGLALLAVIAAASWLWSQYEAMPTAPERDPVSVPPGYYLSGAVLTGTDAEGRIQYRMRAGRAEERPASNTLEFSDVEIAYAPAQDIPWIVRATTATGPADLTQLELSGQVSLESSRPGRDPLRIETTQLQFQPEQLIARSDQPVQIAIGTRRINAVGMSVYLKEDRLQLESQVRGQFLR